MADAAANAIRRCPIVPALPYREHEFRLQRGDRLDGLRAVRRLAHTAHPFDFTEPRRNPARAIGSSSTIRAGTVAGSVMVIPVGEDGIAQFALRQVQVARKSRPGALCRSSRPAEPHNRARRSRRRFNPVPLPTPILSTSMPLFLVVDDRTIRLSPSQRALILISVGSTRGAGARDARRSRPASAMRMPASVRSAPLRRSRRVRAGARRNARTRWRDNAARMSIPERTE